MIKVSGSKSIICSKKEIKMMCSLGLTSWVYMYELPLFHIDQKPVESVSDIKTEHVLLRGNNGNFTESFFKRVNKSWDKQYKK